jgi:MarR family transcriptional regulator, organic hydroperoxide resistance regulator
MNSNANTTRDGKRKQRSPSVADDRFPPLSISIGHFLTDGSDREFRQLIYRLLSFSGLMTRHRDYYASYIGVTGPQYSMLSVIAENRTVTVSQIADHMRVSSQFVAAEIGKLMRNDLVQKRPNETDGRSMYLGLTAKGQNLLRELGPIRRDSNDLMYGSLTEEKAKALREIIETLIVDAERAIHALDAPDKRGEKAPSARPEKPLAPGNPSRKVPRFVKSPVSK